MGTKIVDNSIERRHLEGGISLGRTFKPERSFTLFNPGVCGLQRALALNDIINLVVMGDDNFRLQTVNHMLYHVPSHDMA